MARRRRWAVGAAVVAVTAAVVLPPGFLLSMPGRSHEGALLPLTPDEEALAEELAAHVAVLAGEIGERNLAGHREALDAAALYVERVFAGAGQSVRSQPFEAGGAMVRNVEVVVEGTDPTAGILVVGAHYDSAPGTPGADDNATGTAALLALARRIGPGELRRSVHFVAFVNEEPPWFRTDQMGSAVYAQALAEAGVAVHGMLALESLGYYRDAPGTQVYPAPLSWFYPDTGDFVGFVGTLDARTLVRRAIRAFREGTAFPSEGAVLPAFVPGVDWSDHGPFAARGFPALMVTDTAPYRNPHYHERSDTPDTVDTSRLARVVAGLEAVVRALANE